MKIRFLFYRASQERWNWAGHAIALWTALLPMNWGRWKYWYSHVEVWFPDKNGHFQEIASCDGNFPYLGQCFSSTTRGDAEGTRFIPANELLKHPERWDYIECYVPTLQEVYEWCETQVGKRYDYWGLFGFFGPFNIQHGKKWYCSELAAHIAWLLLLTVPEHYRRISPRRLAAILAKKYHEPKRLG